MADRFLAARATPSDAGRGWRPYLSSPRQHGCCAGLAKGLRQAVGALSPLGDSLAVRGSFCSYIPGRAICRTALRREWGSKGKEAPNEGPPPSGGGDVGMPCPREGEALSCAPISFHAPFVLGLVCPINDLLQEDSKVPLIMFLFLLLFTFPSMLQATESHFDKSQKIII